MLKEVEKELNEDTDELTISRECDITGKLYSVTVPLGLYIVWQEGEHVQKVFPEMSADDREFLISGNTPAEWEEMFKDVKED